MMNKFSFGFQTLSRDDSLFYSYRANDIILCIFSIVISIFGLGGNGTFLWLLVFNIKRNVFTTYLLNFSLASFGFLSVILFICVCRFLSNFDVHIDIEYVDDVIPLLLLMTWNSSRFILAIMSIHRCVFVLHPSWYLRHKSPNLPVFMCFLIWVLSSLMFGILFFLSSKGLGPYYEIVLFWGPFFLCVLVVTVSTLTLFIKVCFKSQPQQRGALTIAILLTLHLFFLLDAFVIIMVFIVNHYCSMLFVWSGCSLVSSLNPLIYFLVGRWKGSQVQASMKVTLQRVFKEEEPPPANHAQLQSHHHHRLFTVVDQQDPEELKS